MLPDSLCAINDYGVIRTWATKFKEPNLHVLLGGHDELVVDDVVGGEAHAEEGRGGVQVHRHPRPRVHVLPDPLQSGRLQSQSHAGRVEKDVL